MSNYLFFYWSSNVIARNECHRKENILQTLSYRIALNQSFWHLHYNVHCELFTLWTSNLICNPHCTFPQHFFLWHAMTQSAKYLCFTLIFLFLLLVTTLLNGKDSLEERPEPVSRNSPLQDSRSLLDTSLLSAPPPQQNNQLHRYLINVSRTLLTLGFFEKLYFQNC